MRICVSGNYKRGATVQVNAHGRPGRLWITRRQYQSAARRLALVDGDFLRLAPCGNDPQGDVLVYGTDGVWGVIS